MPVQTGPAGPGVGWVAEEDVILTSWITDAADRLAAALASDGQESITLLLTSGKRTARSQAAAIKYLMGRGRDLAALESLYRAHADVIREIYPLLVAGDLDGAAAVLEEQPVSAHQRGEAADIRRTDDAQAARVMAAASAAGLRVLDEGDVLHLGA